MTGTRGFFLGREAMTPPLRGLILRLDASDLSTINKTVNAVNSWTDKTATARVFTPTNGQKPTYDSTLFGGRGGLIFNDAASNELDSSVPLSELTLNLCTIFMVMYRTKSFTASILKNIADGGNILTFPENFRMGAFQAYTAYGMPVNQGLLYTQRNNSGVGSFYLNNGVKRPIFAGVQTTLNFNYACGNLRLGTGDFKVGALYIYNRALSDSEVRVMNAYLVGKWGLASTTPTRNVVWDGSSLAFETGVGGDDTTFVKTNKLLGIAQHEALNFGISGQTTTTCIANAATNVDPTYNATLLAKYNVCVFWEGTNELSTAGKTASDVQTAIQTYCAARRAAGWKVVVGSILPRTTGKTGFETDRQTINAWLRTNYTSFADQLADVGGDATIGATGANTNTTYYVDGTHPSLTGCSIAAPYFQAAIAACMA